MSTGDKTISTWGTQCPTKESSADRKTEYVPGQNELRVCSNLELDTVSGQ